MSEELLRLEGATISRGNRVLMEDFSLTVKRGDWLYIQGENGSGKTTLLESMLGLIPLAEGDIWWQGEATTPVEAGAFQRGTVAYLPQYDNLFASLSLEDNLLLGAGAGGRRNRRERVDLLVSEFPNIRELLKRRPGQTSIGERQLVALLRVLLVNANLIVLDEPTAGVARGLLEEIYRLATSLAGNAMGVVFTEQHKDIALSRSTSVLDLSA